MTVKTGQAWSGGFVTVGATGALVTPSVGPAGALYVNGTATADSVTISGTNPYKWSVTLPALTAGDRVEIYITATVSTIATASFVAGDQADSNLAGEALRPTTAGRTLDVTATGEAGIDWANIGSPTTTVGLSGTTVKTATDVEALLANGTYGLSALEALVDDIESRLTATRAGYLDNLSGGAVALASGVAVTSIGNDAITAAAIATNAIDADALAADAITEIQAGLSTLSAAQVNAEVVDALTVDVIADSVATDGNRPTIAQALLELTRFLMERSVSSTTMTVKKEDGTTASMTFTLDSATAPTAITRAS